MLFPDISFMQKFEEEDGSAEFEYPFMHLPEVSSTFKSCWGDINIEDSNPYHGR